MFSRYKAKEQKEKQFAKEALSKSLYEEKTLSSPVQTPVVVDPNIDQEEVEYLRSLNFFLWIIYPFVKMGTMIITCKRRKVKIN